MAGAAVLDRVFRALSDATRREVVDRLTRGPATVSELAQPHGVSLDRAAGDNPARGGSGTFAKLDAMLGGMAGMTS